jgi:hypothetical protein
LAAASVFEFFEDKDARAFAEDKAVAASIKWARGAGGGEGEECGGSAAAGE